MYTGYGIGFDSRSEFLLPYGTMGKNVIIFGADLSSYVRRLQIGLKIYLLLKQLKTQCRGHMLLEIYVKKLLERFTKKNCKKKKKNQKEFSVEKLIKRKSDKLYVKWKGYNNSFNSWINKKDIV